MPNLASFGPELPVAILDILPNPVLIKDGETRYVWVNKAFEELFSVSSDALVGQLDKDLFPGRQVAQCNGGDLRVLDSGQLDEAYETVFSKAGQPIETVTRKSRLVLADGTKLLIGVMHDVTDITKANERLEEIGFELAEKAVQLKLLAETDVLTQCLNRRALFERAEAMDPRQPLGLAILDLDHFKSVNDTFGHEAGDMTLKAFAKCIQAFLKDDEIFARLGGEEFVLLLPGFSEARLRRITETVRRLWEETDIDTSAGTIHSSVSIGAVHCPANMFTNFDALMAVADGALYEAKEDGRNCVKVTRVSSKEAA